MTKTHKIFILLLSALLIASVIMICREVYLQQKEKKMHDDLLQLIEIPEPSTTPEDTETGLPEEPDETEPEAQRRNLSPLIELNSECIGWIFIEGTNVDYPVMHTPNNPQKYLRLNFNGEYSVSGVPFLDARCNPYYGTLLIYGHNMKNGTQFSDLKNYLDADFRNTHPIIEFETEVGIRFFTVVDVIRTDIYDEIYNEIATDDTTLILSTCYGSAKSGRLLIIAKEVEPNVQKKTEGADTGAGRGNSHEGLF